MTYEDFKKALMEKVMQITGNQDVEIRRYEKENGFSYDGLTIFNPDTKTSPVVPVQDFFERHTAGRSIEEIADEVVSFHREHMVHETFDVSSFVDYGQMKNRLRIRLLNRAMNVDRLKNVPVKEILDLAACLYLEVEDIVGIPNAILTVRDQELLFWGKTFDEVYAVAEANMKMYEPPVLTHIEEALNNIAKDMGLTHEIQGKIEREQVPMFVLTTKGGAYGAAAILDLAPIRELSTRLNSDLYIIPSSINEVIILSEDTKMDTNGARALVKAVNRHVVDAKEVLSNQVYRYKRDLDTITFAE